MAVPQVIEAIEQQEWPDQVGEALEKVVSALQTDSPACRTVENILHGTWVGHPLHPILTDLPLGAWSTALVLDATDMARGTDEMGPGADCAIALGLAGAVATAATGIVDWHKTDGRARKVGVAHGVLNLAGTALYAASLLLRRQGRRGAGRSISFLGYASVFAAAYLGGHLVYGERVGVDHAHDYPLPKEFVPVLPEAELRDGEMKEAEAEDAPVLLVRQGGRLYALANTCSHLGCSLHEGELQDGSVQCPCHGSRFALEDGRVLNGPATFPQPCLQSRIREGQIEVRFVE